MFIVRMKLDHDAELARDGLATRAKDREWQSSWPTAEVATCEEAEKLRRARWDGKVDKWEVYEVTFAIRWRLDGDYFVCCKTGSFRWDPSRKAAKRFDTYADALCEASRWDPSRKAAKRFDTYADALCEASRWGKARKKNVQIVCITKKVHRSAVAFLVRARYEKHDCYIPAVKVRGYWGRPRAEAKRYATYEDAAHARDNWDGFHKAKKSVTRVVKK